MDPRFFLPYFHGPHASCLGHKRKEKNLVYNLLYGTSHLANKRYVLSCIVLYCIVLYCIVFHCIALYFIALYYIVLYYIVLYCIVLYCIVLYCIV